jgi:hypothetical protein
MNLPAPTVRSIFTVCYAAASPVKKGAGNKTGEDENLCTD